MRVRTALSVSAAIGALVAAPADANSPGRNGQIAFSAVPQHHRYASSAIFTAHPSGRRAKQLTGRNATRRTAATEPVFSPDGSQIAYTADGYLRVMRADGKYSRRVIKLAVRNGLSLTGRVTWSPRARSLALEGNSYDPSDPENTITDQAIYLVESDGSGLRRIRGGFNPVWAPDGKTIAYNSVADCGGIGLMKPSGEFVRTLVPGRCGSGGPGIANDFSPGGRTLIFSRTNAYLTSTAPTSDLFTVSVATRNVRQLTRTARYAEEDARFSPDGKRLAFARRARTSNRPAVFGTYIATTSAKVLSRFHEYPLRVSWQARR